MAALDSRFQIGVIAFLVMGGWIAAATGASVPQARQQPSHQSLDKSLVDNLGTVCGPIACYIAVRKVGESTSLQEMAERCEWEQGKPVSLQKMHAALLSTPGVTSKPIKLSPRQLHEYLGGSEQMCAILAVRRDSEAIDHAIVALGVRGGDGEILILDYPTPNQFVTWSQLSQRWDGDALLVSRAPSSVRKSSVGILLMGGASVAALVSYCWPRMRRVIRNRRGAA